MAEDEAITRLWALASDHAGVMMSSPKQENPMAQSLMPAFIAQFGKIKRMAEGVIAQMTDSQLHTQINPRQNSVAVIVQHLAGNMVSRWTDFLSTDGEKPNRDRETEFADRELTRPQLLDLWNNGWQVLFAALGGLTDADLRRTVFIRREAHSVQQAITRQIAHYSLHAGQMLVIGKHLVGEGWQYLTIPPGGSATFNARKGL